jgi:hypothetical protein
VNSRELARLSYNAAQPSDVAAMEMSNRFVSSSASVKKRVRFEGNLLSAHIIKKMKRTESKEQSLDENQLNLLYYDKGCFPNRENEMESDDDSNGNNDDDDDDSDDNDTSSVHDDSLDEQEPVSQYDGPCNADGECDGRGVERILVGTRCVQEYEGEFKAGLRCGKGRITFPGMWL